MGAAAIGFVIGMALGAGTGTAAGAFVGGVLGMLLGVTAHGVLWVRDHLGEAPTLEHHRLVCSSYGAVADCELVGDLERRRWLDVRRCSLRTRDREPSCDKRCLRLINDAGVRPGTACHCQDPGQDPAAP